MKKQVLFILFIALFNAAPAQNFFTTFFAGVSNYRGDLGDGKSFLPNSHPAFGLGCMYELNHRMLVEVNAKFGNISGSDKLSINNNRNLSFYSAITEYSVGFEYVLFDLYEYKVSPYASIGAAAFKFNPFTKDRNGVDVNLYEQNTEGQGFYNGRKLYKLRQCSIPFGGGLQWAISDDKRISLNIGIRKTFTDYIDDVSTTYVDPDLLSAMKGSTSVSLAYRGAELQTGSPDYPAAGTNRGNPATKDWYLFSGVTYRVRMSAHRSKPREDKVNTSRAKTTCPAAF